MEYKIWLRPINSENKNCQDNLLKCEKEDRKMIQNYAMMLRALERNWKNWKRKRVHAFYARNVIILVAWCSEQFPEQYIRKDETTPVGFLLKPKNPKRNKKDTSSKVEKKSEEKYVDTYFRAKSSKRLESF